MKELYNVRVYNDSESFFKESYSEDEIKVIMKFFNDMSKHKVARYDFPAIEFEKDGVVITPEDYMDL